MSKICPLFSSSSGNSTYIGTKDGAVLVDAGVSFKSLVSALAAAGGDIAEIKAVAVTHEHSDHILGLKTLLSRSGAMLLASAETLATLQKKDVVPASTKVFAVDEADTQIAGINVHRFATSHDCPGSSGYSFTLSDGKKVSVCTDLGIVTDEVRGSLLGSDVLVFESNHDIEMLKKGPYPPITKARILSDKGHISNVACAAELPKLLDGGTTRFILAHLSQNNNTPVLARATAESALVDVGAINGEDYLLKVASPFGNGVTVI